MPEIEPQRTDHSEPALEYLFTVTANVEQPHMLAGAPHGTRGIINVVGGTFDGPRLHGTLIPPGGDWFTVRASGSLFVDAKLLLVTDDAIEILMSYQGLAVPGEAGLHIRVAPRFEAPEGPYAWLNDLQAVGAGRTAPGAVTYDVYALS